MTDETIILSVELIDYPSLFNRRIHIPIEYNLFEISIAILSSLRITDFEDFYQMWNKYDGVVYDEELTYKSKKNLLK